MPVRFLAAAVLAQVLGSSNALIVSNPSIVRKGAVANAPWSAPLQRRQSTLAGKKRRSEERDNEDIIDDQRMTFEEAGASLMEQEDRKRLEAMGDFDRLDYGEDDVESMRAAIRARTAGLGMEKSKLSAEFNARSQDRAIQAGPGGGKSDEVFGGLDLSKISKTKQASSGDWNENMPTMFFDVEKTLSREEMEAIDPLMLKNPLEQASFEVRNSRFPNPFDAIKKSVIILAVVVLSTVFIYAWDKVLYYLYTSLHWLPTEEDMANYASRFDGLDLPSGWFEKMDVNDVERLSTTLKNAGSPMAENLAPPSATEVPSAAVEALTMPPVGEGALPDL